MNVQSKCSNGGNHSRCASAGRCYLHCGINETCGSGIISVKNNQLSHLLSVHGTSAMGQYLLAKGFIVKLKEWTESNVIELTSSTMDDKALSISKRQGSRGVTIATLRWKLIFDILVNPY
jgi:hypothetical protein